MLLLESLKLLTPAQFLAWVVMVWLACAAAFWVRLAGGWVVAARMRKRFNMTPKGPTAAAPNAPPDGAGTYSKSRSSINFRLRFT